MSRKIGLLLGFVILLLIVGAVPVLAGDIPESALTNANYCFIGTIEKVDGTTATLKISEVVFGSFSEKSVDILDFEYATGQGLRAKPKINDYCAVVVETSPDGLRVYGRLAAKADSLDKKTLKLKSTDQFIRRMNNYINNGHYSNETIEKFNQFRDDEANSVTNSVDSSLESSKPDVAVTSSPAASTSNGEPQDNSLSNSTIAILTAAAAAVIIGGLAAAKRNKEK
ncbi:MAG: hypothetical protein ACOYWZ_23160 [Bacillota bacterium]